MLFDVFDVAPEKLLGKFFPRIRQTADLTALLCSRRIMSFESCDLSSQANSSASIFSMQLLTLRLCQKIKILGANSLK